MQKEIKNLYKNDIIFYNVTNYMFDNSDYKNIEKYISENKLNILLKAYKEKSKLEKEYINEKTKIKGKYFILEKGSD
jgi:uncharacterized membrane protein YgaE (UPF0421/DUF939 family)